MNPVLDEGDPKNWRTGMRTHQTNPERNQLPPGIDEEVLLRSIESSGYPLQGIVAGLLSQQFTVAEEWGFLDRDTKEHRTLDLYASRVLSQEENAPIQPTLILLIECKRSRQPYVFFQSAAKRPLLRFPHIAGLRNGEVVIQEAGGKRISHMPGASGLQINELPFVNPGPPSCAAFTKAIPTGKKVELSGTDPFNSLVLPLVKALDHASDRFKVKGEVTQLFPKIVLCVSVLDAPMLVVEDPHRPADPVLAPWVRIVRQEANPDPKAWDWYRFYFVDAVHIDFFEAFIQQHLLPFAEEFSRRAIQLGGVLLGGGEVSRLGEWKWNDVRPRPKAR
jgi:hypothetical protein